MKIDVKLLDPIVDPGEFDRACNNIFLKNDTTEDHRIVAKHLFNRMVEDWQGYFNSGVLYQLGCLYTQLARELNFVKLKEKVERINVDKK